MAIVNDVVYLLQKNDAYALRRDQQRYHAILDGTSDPVVPPHCLPVAADNDQVRDATHELQAVYIDTLARAQRTGPLAHCDVAIVVGESHAACTRVLGSYETCFTTQYTIDEDTDHDRIATGVLQPLFSAVCAPQRVTIYVIVYVDAVADRGPVDLRATCSVAYTLYTPRLPPLPTAQVDGAPVASTFVECTATGEIAIET